MTSRLVGVRLNAAGSLFMQGAQRLSRIVALVPAAILLASEELATLVLALAVADLVRAGLLGFDVSAIRRLTAGEDRDRLLAGYLAAKAVAGLALGALAIALAAVLYGWDVAAVTLASMCGTIPAALAGLILVDRQVRFALAPAAGVAALSGLAGAGLAILSASITRSALGVVAGFVVGDVLLLLLVAGLGSPPVPRIIRDVGYQGLGRLSLMQVAYIGQFRVGVIVLGLAGTAHAVAEYGLAARLAEGMVVLASAFTASTYPLMAHSLARGERSRALEIFRRSIEASVTAAAVAVGGTLAFAPVWAPLLFPRYPGIVSPFAIVGVAMVLFFATSQTTALLNAARDDIGAAGSATASVLLTGLATWLLVPNGAVGVAAARVAGESLRLAIEVMRADSIGRVIGSVAVALLRVVPLAVATVTGSVLGLSTAARAGLVVVGSVPALAPVILRRRQARDRHVD